MKRPRVEFLRHAALRQAATEVEEAWKRYAERSTPAASDFPQEIDHAIQLAVERPRAWQVLEADTRRIVMQRSRFSIILRTAPGMIQVAAVAHHKRRPGYWRQRRSRPPRLSS